MRIVEINAVVPSGPSSRDALEKSFRSFDIVRRLVEDTTDRSRLLASDYRESIAQRAGADSYMVEDVAAVMLGLHRPVLPEYVEAGFWSFGRQAGIGTPWVGFSYEHDTVNVLIRRAPEGEEDGESLQWVQCLVETQDETARNNLFEFLYGAFLMDVWLLMHGGHLVGRVVARD